MASMADLKIIYDQLVKLTNKVSVYVGTRDIRWEKRLALLYCQVCEPLLRAAGIHRHPYGTRLGDCMRPQEAAAYISSSRKV